MAVSVHSQLLTVLGNLEVQVHTLLINAGESDPGARNRAVAVRREVERALMTDSALREDR